MIDGEPCDGARLGTERQSARSGDLFVGRTLVVRREHGPCDYFPLMDNDDWVVRNLPQPETVLSARTERLILARLCARDAQGVRREGPWRVFPTVCEALAFLRELMHEPTET